MRKERRRRAKRIYWWRLKRQYVADVLWDGEGRAHQRHEYRQQIWPVPFVWTWLKSCPAGTSPPALSPQPDDRAERGESSSILQGSEHVEDVSQNTVRRRWISRVEASEMSSYLQYITPTAFQRFLLERAEYDTQVPQDGISSAGSSSNADARDDLEAATPVPPYRSRRASSLPMNFFRSPPPRYSFVSQQPMPGNSLARTNRLGTVVPSNSSNITYPALTPSAATHRQAIHTAEANNQEDTYPALTPDGPAEGKSDDDNAPPHQGSTGMRRLSKRLRSWSASRRSTPDPPLADQNPDGDRTDTHEETQEHDPGGPIVGTTANNASRTFSWDPSRRTTLDVPHRVRQSGLAERRTLQDYEAESMIDDATAFRDGSQTTASTYYNANHWHRDPPRSINQPTIDMPERALAMLNHGSKVWQHTPEESSFYYCCPSLTAELAEDQSSALDLDFPRRRIRRRHSIAIPVPHDVEMSLQDEEPLSQDERHDNDSRINLESSQAEITSPIPTIIPSNDGADDGLDIPRKRAASPKKSSSHEQNESFIIKDDTYTLANLPSSTSPTRRNVPFTNPFAPSKPYTPTNRFSATSQSGTSTIASLHRRGASVASTYPFAAEILRPFSPDVPLAKRASSVPLSTPHSQETSAGITEWQLYRRHQSI
ncbi:MAG: hypothetical protein Q9164_005907, partial [Protoblastenia rupestris]